MQQNICNGRQVFAMAEGNLKWQKDILKLQQDVLMADKLFFGRRIILKAKGYYQICYYFLCPRCDNYWDWKRE